ncbi:MAG TPA: transposase [Micromonospora sp.]|nr:transposase [Micromonospora sp.]
MTASLSSWSSLRPTVAKSAGISRRSEAHWIRYARIHLRGMFPYLPQRPGYNKRLRAALPLIKKAIRELARDSDFWFDNHWIVDSTPVPCGMSRPMVQRSDLAGWAGYGYCEREVLAAMLQVEAGVVAEHDGILLISDKGFASKTFERHLAEQGIELLRPSRKREKARYGEAMLKKVRQLIESVNDTLRGQLDLEEHGGHTFAGVAVRVAQRLLAMAAAIWHNNKTGAPVTRSLIAYDH